MILSKQTTSCYSGVFAVDAMEVHYLNKVFRTCRASVGGVIVNLLALNWEAIQ